MHLSMHWSVFVSAYLHLHRYNTGVALTCTRAAAARSAAYLYLSIYLCISIYLSISIQILGSDFVRSLSSTHKV